MARAICKVPRCKIDHEKHVCFLCKNIDSDHYSSECPNGKTLYHGTSTNFVKPISVDGLKASPDGRLGPGVYFVEEKSHADAVSKYHRSTAGNDDKIVVFKCQVNLGDNKDVGGNVDATWQLRYDSATGIHPPGVGIQNNFREYCLKSKNDCVITSIIINDRVIQKDKDLTWGEAEVILQTLDTAATPDTKRRAVTALKSVSKSMKYEASVGLFPALKKEVADIKRKRKRFQNRLKIRGLKICNKPVWWLLKRWYLIYKTFMILVSIAIGMYSVNHLYSKRNDKMIGHLASFSLFFTLQAIANVVFLVTHIIDSLENPHRISNVIPLTKIFIAFLFEIPMMVFQAHALKNVENLVWDELSWDLSLRLLFLLNIWMFSMVDLLYIGSKRNGAHLHTLTLWIVFETLVFSTVMTVLAFTPVYLIQAGWNWRPNLEDFGGKFGNEGDFNHNMLVFSMYMGMFGLWIWPVAFPLCCLMISKILFKVSLNSMIKRWFIILKFFLVIFNICNGIWSLDHLYSNKKQQIEGALISFALFFTMQSIANIAFIIMNAVLSSEKKSEKDNYILVPFVKVAIAFCLEVPMLTSQAYAMRYVENLVWSDLIWDFIMQTQFMFNFTLFLLIDFVYMNRGAKIKVSSCCALSLFFFLIVLLLAMVFTPVYMAHVGWFVLNPNLSDFGGTIGTDNGIQGLLKTSMIIGVTGFWLWWIIVLSILGAIAGAIAGILIISIVYICLVGCKASWNFIRK